MGKIDTELPSFGAVDYCGCCELIDGLEEEEALILWQAGTEIRDGDLVALEHDTGKSKRKMYLRAQRSTLGLQLRTRCGLPPFPIYQGARELTNGLLAVKIVGILRGAYLPL